MTDLLASRASRIGRTATAAVIDGLSRELSDPAGHAAFESLYGLARRANLAASAEAEVERDALVVRHLGPLHPPPRSFGDGPALGRYVGEAIGAISLSPSDGAARWLRYLSKEAPLQAWSEPLRHAFAVQKSVRLEAAFTAPQPADVARALASGPPAVPADLRAVVVEVLSELARDIRDGPTSAWRSFWSRPTGGPATPTIENECRDLLADRLSDRLLPFRIPVRTPVVTEARSGNDRRVDMAVLGERGGSPADRGQEALQRGALDRPDGPAPTVRTVARHVGQRDIPRAVVRPHKPVPSRPYRLGSARSAPPRHSGMRWCGTFPSKRQAGSMCWYLTYRTARRSRRRGGEAGGEGNGGSTGAMITTSQAREPKAD